MRPGKKSHSLLSSAKFEGTDVRRALLHLLRAPARMVL